jgi:hypothetical protein
VEWLATEKINVHGSPSLNWGAPENQVDPIRRLNALLSVHPAFFHPVRVEMIQQGPGNAIVAARRCETDGKGLLILVNLDAASPNEAAWDPGIGLRCREIHPSICLPGIRQSIGGDRTDGTCVLLEPGQVFCLTSDPADLDAVTPYRGPIPAQPGSYFQATASGQVTGGVAVLPGGRGPGRMGPGPGRRTDANVAPGFLPNHESRQRRVTDRGLAVPRRPAA